MLYYVCSYSESSQKYLYVSLILSIYIRRKSILNKLVLHQILNKI